MRVRTYFATREWQKDLLLLGALALLAGLFFMQLGSLVPGASTNEIAARTDSSSLRNIVHDPLFAPHKLLQYGLQKVGLNGIIAMRSVSVAFALLFVIAFHRLIRRWHSRRIALITTGLVASSSWLLTTGRNATPIILFTSWFFIIFLVFWFRHSHKVRLAPPLFFGLLTLVLYIPGSVYLLGFLAFWYMRKAPDFFRFMKRVPIVIGSLCGLLLIAPLLFAFVRHPSLITEWLLLPDSLSIGEFFGNLQNLLTTFFYQSQPNSEFWLARLPLLDVFTGTMMILGIYAYRYHLRLERTLLIGLVVLLGIIVIGAAGPKMVIILLPFAYVLIANGMAFLLEQWYAIFPRNPVARTLATSLLSIAVLFTCYYHINRYFVAWANAPETKAIYSVKIER